MNDMSETVTMYFVVDEIDEKGRAINTTSRGLLAFTTREEAESFKLPNQKILERDGCPIQMAISIADLSRERVGKKELKE